jgi:hypothetical protein
MTVNASNDAREQANIPHNKRLCFFIPYLFSKQNSARMSRARRERAATHTIAFSADDRRGSRAKAGNGLFLFYKCKCLSKKLNGFILSIIFNKCNFYTHQELLTYHPKEPEKSAGKIQTREIYLQPSLSAPETQLLRRSYGEGYSKRRALL